MTNRRSPSPQLKTIETSLIGSLSGIMHIPSVKKRPPPQKREAKLMPIPQFEPVRVPDEVEYATREPTPSPRIKQEPRVTYGQRLSAQGLQQQQQQQQYHSQRQQHSGEGLVPVSQRPLPSHEAQPPERINAPSRLISPSPSTNSSRSSNPGNHPLQVKTERRTPSGEQTAPTIAFEFLITSTLFPPLRFSFFKREA